MAEAAVDFATLRPAIAAGLDAAGAAHGHRSQAEGAPWNFPVRVAGTVTEAKTDTRAATAGVDTDGDGKPDATVQLGPVIRGTSLRDVLPFVDFTAFRDQIAYAELGRALNDQAYANALEALPRDALVGKPVTVVGAFTLKAPGDPIVITPVSAEVGS
jgi:predicted lipoprotein